MSCPCRVAVWHPSLGLRGGRKVRPRSPRCPSAGADVRAREVRPVRVAHVARRVCQGSGCRIRWRSVIQLLCFSELQTVRRQTEQRSLDDEDLPLQVFRTRCGFVAEFVHSFVVAADLGLDLHEHASDCGVRLEPLQLPQDGRGEATLDDGLEGLGCRALLGQTVRDATAACRDEGSDRQKATEHSARSERRQRARDGRSSRETRRGRQRQTPGGYEDRCRADTECPT